jgi:hypothetical protein
MSLTSKLKHIFIISVIVASFISSTTTTTIITTFVPPMKHADYTATVAATTVFALSDEERYDSGYNHGCSDAKTGDHPYLEDSGGEDSHTDTFMQGYNDGYSKCHDPNSKSDDNNGISDSFANGTDSNSNEILLSKQNEDISSTPLPNSTSFHALTFLKSHFKILGLTVLSVGVALLMLGLIAFRRRHKIKKSRERKDFHSYVKQNILRKQDHRCAHCRKILNVVDWDHKNGDRSNNQENNCQALCPNCHAIKTRKEQGKR